jgi:ferrochelatase
VRESLNLPEDKVMTTFQSRFGREPWLQPYTDETLEQLPEQGTKHITVICPGFSSDCLETIEEINMEGREIFMEAGGEAYHYIPCLNSDSAHIEALADVVNRQLS